VEKKKRKGQEVGHDLLMKKSGPTRKGIKESVVGK